MCDHESTEVFPWISEDFGFQCTEDQFSCPIYIEMFRTLVENFPLSYCEMRNYLFREREREKLLTFTGKKNIGTMINTSNKEIR